jgi:hypothetical protein
VRYRLLAGVLVILLGIGLFALFSNLNSLVAKTIEKHGSRATGTRVAVSGVDISLKEGRGAIEGLEIDNPPEYSSAKAFQLDQIEIDIDLESVRKDPIVIESVLIRAPSVHAEFREDGSSNLDAIRKHLESLAGSSEPGKGGAGDSKEQKRIRIRSFVFEKGSIRVDASALGIEARTLELPAIRLSDVGGSGGGTPDELAKEILGTVVTRAAREVARSGVLDFLEKNLSEPVKEGARKLLDALKN